MNQNSKLQNAAKYCQTVLASVYFWINSVPSLIICTAVRDQSDGDVLFWPELDVILLLEKLESSSRRERATGGFD